MNSYGKYAADRAEVIEEEGEQAFNNIMAQEREKALASYPPGADIHFCSICNEPMRYGSVSYYEGWHIDSCV